MPTPNFLLLILTIAGYCVYSCFTLGRPKSKFLYDELDRITMSKLRELQRENYINISIKNILNIDKALSAMLLYRLTIYRKVL